MTEWTAETLPPEVVALHDAVGGTSLRGLAEILNAYDALRPAVDLAWAADQAEQVAVKYEQFAEREPNPLIKTCYEFTARIVRAEFLGQHSGGVNGRFASTAQSGQEAT